ncbi:MAG: hypothetical protein OEY49_17360, partial [Candidatus Heimdallarchaeota archaeon]|nr:hypothetical protein [Candidatus Heimdallarchaeota archaeon]
MVLPENLPPVGLDQELKIILYFGVFYFILSAIVVRLITKKRLANYKKNNEPAISSSTSEIDLTLGTGQTLRLSDTKDILASLKVEIAGAEGALGKLNELKEVGEITSTAHEQLSHQYSSMVKQISQKMNDMLKSSIESDSGEIYDGISENDMVDINADLEAQLMALDSDDDFLSRKTKTRSKTPISALYSEDEVNSSGTNPVPKQESSVPTQPIAAAPLKAPTPVAPAPPSTT